MATFKIVNISLGNITPGIQQDIYYPYEGIERISKMISPCDCSVPVNDINSSKIWVRYTPKSIPIHLKQKGTREMTIKKVITIEYFSKDEPQKKQTILLSFNAIVKE